MQSLLELRDITKTFGTQTTLHQISLTIEPREVVFLVGPSGSGKSTLLRCCNLLERPTSGAVIFNGEDITHKRHIDRIRQSIGMVFQSFNLYPHMTALWNVSDRPPSVQRLPAKAARERAMHLWAASASRIGRPIIPRSFRADNNSASRLRAP